MIMSPAIKEQLRILFDKLRGLIPDDQDAQFNAFCVGFVQGREFQDFAQRVGPVTGGTNAVN